MCRFALAPSNFDGEVIFNNREVYRSIYQLLEQGYAAPDVLILEIGLSDVAADHPKQFIQQYRDVVTQLQKIRPGMKIVVGSILPVTSGKHDQLPAQKQINLYNYQLAKMCQEMQLPFLETAEAFMHGFPAALPEFEVQFIGIAAHQNDAVVQKDIRQKHRNAQHQNIKKQLFVFPDQIGHSFHQ